jgi:hypothetical protein
MDSEMIADRRRLRRKLSFWRVLAVLGLIAAVVAAGLTATRNASTLAGGSLGSRHIARISVDGFIAGNSRMADLMKRVGEASNVAGVVIAVDSPGGTTTGAEELYRNIRQLAGKKPVVAFVDGTAASGGYITALGADRIVARETSLVGSIGVLFQYPDVSGLLQTVGVKVEEIKSARSKPSRARSIPRARKRARPCATSSWTLSTGSRASSPTAQDRRGRARDGVERARVQRAPGDVVEARRPDRGRARRRRLARAREGSRQGPADPRLAAAHVEPAQPMDGQRRRRRSPRLRDDRLAPAAARERRGGREP